MDYLVNSKCETPVIQTSFDLMIVNNMTDLFRVKLINLEANSAVTTTVSF